jgi:hypothetical protein
MGSGKNIDELLRLKGLSPQELELHRSLIDKCKERETMIMESAARTQGSLQQLAEACEAATQRARTLAAAIEKVLDEMEDLCLKLLPDDQFYHD